MTSLFQSTCVAAISCLETVILFILVKSVACAQGLSVTVYSIVAETLFPEIVFLLYK